MSGYAGGCLCGAVKFTVAGPLREILVCHCGECRRWCGRAWPATAASRNDLSVVRGAVRWCASPGSASSARRGSCSACGSCLFWDAPGRDTVSISACSLDEPSSLRVAAHIYVADGVPWDVPPAGMTTFPGAYPESAPALRRH